MYLLRLILLVCQTKIERGFNLIKLNLHRYLNNLELLNVVNKQREY